MGSLILVRHGESRWNLDNRFTGWVDVPLSEEGIREAQACAMHCKKYDYTSAFTSMLSRAQATLLVILSQQNRTGIFQHPDDSQYAKWIRASNRHNGDGIPVYMDHRLNERYYGALQGMEKDTAEKKFGTEQVITWRRGYLEQPPGGESLKDAHERMHPYLVRAILPRVRKGENVLLVAHGNTLRAAIKHIEEISEEDIAFIDLPKAKPIVYGYRAGKYTRIGGEYTFKRPLR